MNSLLNTLRHFREYSTTAILGILFLPLTFNVSYAVIAKPGLFTLTQADGRSFVARQWGDEWNHGTETSDGYTIIFDEKSRNWVFATRSTIGDGDIVKSLNVVTKSNPPTGLQRHLRRIGSALRKTTLARLHLRAITRHAPVLQSTGNNHNILTLLINFSNTTTKISSSAFADHLYGPGSGSMSAYYNEASYGKFSVSAGPAGVRGWYKAPRNHDYYDSRPEELVRAAVAAADNAGVDFAPYDFDGDCYVDAVNVIHQGTGEEASGVSSDIWSHQSGLANPYATKSACASGGKIYVSTYIMEPELLGSSIHPIGVFAHEYGHALGLPDLYDTDYSSVGTGDWSLMSSGSWNRSVVQGDTPAHLDAWSKYKLGWSIPTRIVSSDSSPQTLFPANSKASIFQLGGGSPSDPNSEYFLVENRQQAGFDSGLPGSGMLIWHIDESISTNMDECVPSGASCVEQHYKVALVQADNNWDLETNANNGDAGDAFPGVNGRKTSFNDTTAPGSRTYNGRKTSISISAITRSAKNVTANMSVADTPSFNITYTRSGTGTGAVSFSPAGTLATCSQNCTNTYPSGTVVLLTAQPASGSTFQGWSGGGCSGADTCEITVSSAKSVSAQFKKASDSNYACYKLTAKQFAYNADVLKGVRAEFGAKATIAEWTDIKSSFGGSVNEIQAFMNATGIPHAPIPATSNNVFITYGGAQLTNGHRFLMTRLDGNRDDSYGVIDNIQNWNLVLGSWTWKSKALAYTCN